MSQMRKRSKKISPSLLTRLGPKRCGNC